MVANLKRILTTSSLSPAGRAVLGSRDNIELVEFPHHLTGEDFQNLLREHAPVHAVILGATRMTQAELDAAGDMNVVARVGVGYDAIDIPTMTKNKVPVMIAGTANSPSVAEQALFMMLNLAKRANELDSMVRENRWNDRFTAVPFDLFEKEVLVIGFGRIGSRTAKRCNAMEMKVHVYDPYKSAEEIGSAGCIVVKDLDAAVHRRVIADKIGFYDACAQSVFCPLGQGAVDFNGFKEALIDIGYRGWLTVEQDCDPEGDGSPVDDARRSLDFLRSSALAD